MFVLERLFAFEADDGEGLAVKVFEDVRAGNKTFAEGRCFHRQSMYFVAVECTEPPHPPLVFAFRDTGAPKIRSLNGVSIAPDWFGTAAGSPLARLVYLYRAIPTAARSPRTILIPTSNSAHSFRPTHARSSRPTRDAWRFSVGARPKCRDDATRRCDGRPSMLTRRAMIAAGLAAGAAGLAPVVGAPAITRTARILVGFPAGGTTDVIARLLAGAMRDYAPAIVVENRPGRAGTLAFESLKAAPRDGSVLLVAPLATTTLYPHLYKALRFRTAGRFRTGHCGRCGLLRARRQPPGRRRGEDAHRFHRLVPGASRPGDVRIAGHRVAAPFHRGSARACRGIRLHARAASGRRPHAANLLSGHIAWAMLPIDTPLPYLASGALRALATSGPRRCTCLADVPTFRELGYPSLEIRSTGGASSSHPALRRNAWMGSLDRSVRRWKRARPHRTDGACGRHRRRVARAIFPADEVRI